MNHANILRYVVWKSRCEGIFYVVCRVTAEAHSAFQMMCCSKKLQIQQQKYNFYYWCHVPSAERWSTGAHQNPWERDETSQSSTESCEKEREIEEAAAAASQYTSIWLSVYWPREGGNPPLPTPTFRWYLNAAQGTAEIPWAPGSLGPIVRILVKSLTTSPSDYVQFRACKYTNRYTRNSIFTASLAMD